jgi:phosphoglycolate phosphatase
MEKKTYTHIFWDFNGTIIDDFYACFESENDLFRLYGLPALHTAEDYRRLFCFPVKDYYARMGFDFEKTPYERLAAEWMDFYLIHAKNAGLCQGVREALELARSHGLAQWVLSASEKGMLEEQLRTLGVRDYFEGVLGRDDINAGSKTALGVAWREAHPDARVLVLGDTDHDAATAAAMGADCVLVTTGHSTRERLEAQKPLLLASNTLEALRALL